MADSPLDANKPFRVRTDKGVLHSQHKAVEMADNAASVANAAAVDLGVKVQYATHDESE